jgi:hypothetical protein
LCHNQNKQKMAACQCQSSFYESSGVRHIIMSNIPSEKIQKDIENYSFFLTNLYPKEVEITKSSPRYSEWLLKYDSNIGLFE